MVKLHKKRNTDDCIFPAFSQSQNPQGYLGGLDSDVWSNDCGWSRHTDAWGCQRLSKVCDRIGLVGSTLCNSWCDLFIEHPRERQCVAIRASNIGGIRCLFCDFISQWKIHIFEGDCAVAMKRLGCSRAEGKYSFRPIFIIDIAIHYKKCNMANRILARRWDTCRILHSGRK